MRNENLLIAVLFLSLGLFSCSSEPAVEPNGYVTLLGNDTLVVESFVFAPGSVEAEVVIRTPRTRVTRYDLALDDAGNITEMSAKDLDPLTDSLVSESTYAFAGDSVTVTTARNGEVSEQVLAAPAEAIPFIDMVHWPYELALRRMRQAGENSLDLPMLTGRRTSTFEIRIDEVGNATIKHPSRGAMTATVDEAGALLSLDAGATTRKLTVARTSGLEMAAIAARFAAADAAGKSFGGLSGAAETTATVKGANLRITFGQPARRGRELFGGIVPWNQRWRTGANRATHFSSDKDLVINGLEVPAGEYTLFTIPAPDGGTLIINKQTGQNGQSYNEEMDLGRVSMTIGELKENVELFTIEAVETEAGGALQLKWGNTVFFVPFTVK